VTFLPADGQQTGSAAATPLRHSVVNGVRKSAPRDVKTAADGGLLQLETPDAPPAYSSPQPEVVSSTAPVASNPSPDAKREPKRETKSEPDEKLSIAAIKEAPLEVLKSQLAAAEEKIAQLTAKADSGLRQRKGASVGGDGSPGELQQAVRQATEGVAVRTVAILCIVCFLLGYLFF